MLSDVTPDGTVKVSAPTAEYVQVAVPLKTPLVPQGDGSADASPVPIAPTETMVRPSKRLAAASRRTSIRNADLIEAYILLPPDRHASSGGRSATIVHNGRPDTLDFDKSVMDHSAWSSDIAGRTTTHWQAATCFGE